MVAEPEGSALLTPNFDIGYDPDPVPSTNDPHKISAAKFLGSYKHTQKKLYMCKKTVANKRMTKFIDMI